MSDFSHPHSLTQVIRKFAKQLDEWLKIALHDLPENLRNIKFECKYKSPRSILMVYILNDDAGITMFLSFFACSVQEIFSDSQAANILKPSMSGAYRAFFVFNIIHMNQQLIRDTGMLV